ncbi:hypothetical protein ACR03S_00400 [Limimaricola variabilis]
MNRLLGNMPPLSTLIEGVEMTPDIVTRLVTIAYWQSHIASDELLNNVVPRLSHEKQSHPRRVAEQMDSERIFEQSFLDDLSTLIESLEAKVDAGTHIYWHGDENHVRGGYQTIFRVPGVSDFQHAVTELAMLREVVVATICAARSLRDAPDILHI